MDVGTGRFHYGRRLYYNVALRYGKIVYFVLSSGNWTKTLFKRTLALDVSSTDRRLYEGRAHGRYHHIGSHCINVGKSRRLQWTLTLLVDVSNVTYQRY